MRLFSVLLTALLFAPAAFAQPGHGGKGHGHGMRHATPMPNLMRVVVKKGAELNLTKAQNEAFAKWRAEAHPKSMALGKAVREARKAIRDLAYGDGDTAAINKKYDELAAAQRELTMVKIKCRELLKTTLTPEQWTKAVSLHKAMKGQKGPHAHKHGHHGKAAKCGGDCDCGKGKAAKSDCACPECKGAKCDGDCKCPECKDGKCEGCKGAKAAKADKPCKH